MNEIVFVKYIGCGMLMFKNEDVYGIVEKNFGQVYGFQVVVREVNM